VTSTKHGALLVPQRSVTELQGGYQVAVVTPDNKVEIRPVKVGERTGNLWIVEEGLATGDRVVAEGVQKIKPGMTIAPKTFGSAPDGRAT
jgi:membrane fusion protein (multidrug efflux system)